MEFLLVKKKLKISLTCHVTTIAQLMASSENAGMVYDKINMVYLIKLPTQLSDK